MKLMKLSMVLLAIGTGISAIGCGPTTRESTEEERQEIKTKMDDDLKTMTLPKTPGQGQAPPGGAPGAPAPGAPAPGAPAP